MYAVARLANQRGLEREQKKRMQMRVDCKLPPGMKSGLERCEMSSFGVRN